LSNTTSGRTYRLYKGSDAVDELTSTGGAATFTGTFAGAGVYTAQVMAEGRNCAATMSGTHNVSENPLPTGLSLTANPTTICNGQSSTLTAVATGAASYSIDNSTWQTTTLFKVSPTSTTSYPLYVKTAAGCSASATNAAAITVSTPPTAPTSLSSNVTVICNGVSTAATLTANDGNVGSGAVYEWGTGAVGNGTPVTTTGNTYSVSPNAATTYWVRLKGAGACSATTTGGVTTAIAVYLAISPGAITTASTTTKVNTNPNVTIANATAASGGSDNLTYLWRRTGTSSATLTGTTATYTLSSDAVGNYGTVGTYSFNRYAKDATCADIAPVAATGTYTLYVERASPPGTTPTTLCTQCCYTGSTWVDCYVTTNAYPFGNTSNTGVVWSGNGSTFYSGASGSGSDKNGRVNTAAISSTGTTAVQLCKNLGTGWYLPAYEELHAMSSGAANASSNNRAGAGILKDNWHWSSTELYNNGGRASYNDPGYGYRAVIWHANGSGGTGDKAGNAYLVRCAWRN
jgi:hypothetical protein